MGRPVRDDASGMWHHVVNSGVGDRTIFESRRDARQFLAFLARMVRQGLIEIHALTVMGNHYHLLLRSPVGEISAAMKWVQQMFANYFNRTRHRKDSVFGKRFYSREVKSDAHWISIVRYIDMNPVRAGLAATPEEYAYGSARYYCADRAPLWVNRDTVTQYLGTDGPCDADRYRKLWTSASSAHAVAMVKRRMELAAMEYDPLDDLIRGIDGGALAWVRRLARNADGIPAAIALLAPDPVMNALTVLIPEIDGLGDGLGSHPLSAILTAGILRTACGESLPGISGRLQIPYSTLTRLLRHHNTILNENDAYATVAAEFISFELKRAFPSRRRGEPERT